MVPPPFFSVNCLVTPFHCPGPVPSRCCLRHFLGQASVPRSFWPNTLCPSPPRSFLPVSGNPLTVSVPCCFFFRSGVLLVTPSGFSPHGRRFLYFFVGFLWTHFSVSSLLRTPSPRLQGRCALTRPRTALVFVKTLFRPLPHSFGLVRERTAFLKAVVFIFGPARVIVVRGRLLMVFSTPRVVMFCPPCCLFFLRKVSRPQAGFFLPFFTSCQVGGVPP